MRKGGTYHQSLLALNDTLKAQGKPPVHVQFADPTTSKTTTCSRWSTRA